VELQGKLRPAGSFRFRQDAVRIDLILESPKEAGPSWLGRRLRIVSGM
jgi:hypothetical protein